MGDDIIAIFCFCNLKFSHTVTTSSTIDELRTLASSRWLSLSHADFFFTCVCDGHKVNLKLDFQLQAMISYYIRRECKTFDLVIEFEGEFLSSNDFGASSSAPPRGDCNVVEDEMAEDTMAAFVEDGTQVYRPRRLKEWEDALGDVGQEFIGGAEAVRLAVDKHCIAFGFHYTVVKSAPNRYTVKVLFSKSILSLL